MSRTSDPVYRRNRERIYRTESVCWVCGGIVDMTLRWPDPMSRSADHVHPISRGGSNHGELRLAHLGCNRRRQARPIDLVRDPCPTSEDW